MDNIHRFHHALSPRPYAQSPLQAFLGRWSPLRRLEPLRHLIRFNELLIRHSGEFSALSHTFGMIGTERLADWLNELLRAKLGSVADHVTFGDLTIGLRVVAANLRTGLLHAFGGPGDEQTPVAQAVAASACFPLFFKPVSLGPDMFVDGGLVSNLPAWLFDDDREDDPSFLPTFGFRLIDETLTIATPEVPAAASQFVRRLLQTLTSGASNLEERRIDDYHGINLKASIGTLSFDTVRPTAPAIVMAGRDCVNDYFAKNIGPQDPRRIAIALRATIGELGRQYAWQGARVRASVLLPRPNSIWAQVAYSANMEEDADDRLRVRSDVRGVGACFSRKEPVYIRRERVNRSEAGVDKYEMGARPRDITHIYSIPIFHDAVEWVKPDPARRACPFAALVIDTSVALETLLLDYYEQDALANVAAIVGEEVRGHSIVRRPHLGIIETTALPGWEALDMASGILVSRRKMRDAGDAELGGRLAKTIMRAILHGG